MPRIAHDSVLRLLTIAALALLCSALDASAAPVPATRLPPTVFARCGDKGQSCCDQYRGPSGGVIGPRHCNAGLGCNAATNRCESACGKAGNVCCDGPDTVVVSGGVYQPPNAPKGAFVPKRAMCQASSCDRATNRCRADCGQRAGDACCPPQPTVGIATCQGAGLTCQSPGTPGFKPSMGIGITRGGICVPPCLRA